MLTTGNAYWDLVEGIITMVTVCLESVCVDCRGQVSTVRQSYFPLRS